MGDGDGLGLVWQMGLRGDREGPRWLLAVCSPTPGEAGRSLFPVSLVFLIHTNTAPSRLKGPGEYLRSVFLLFPGGTCLNFYSSSFQLEASSKLLQAGALVLWD